MQILTYFFKNSHELNMPCLINLPSPNPPIPQFLYQNID